MYEIIATENDAGRTLYKLLCKYLNNLPLSRIEKLFRKKDIKVNQNRKVTKDQVVNLGDSIVIYGVNDLKKPETFQKISYDFKIIYEDNNILIIDKKSGVVVHSETNCLDNQILSYLNYQNIDSFKPSHIGRLDKETSGLIVYAKNYATLVAFNENNHHFIKRYLFKSDFNLPYLELELYFYKQSDGKIKTSPKAKNGYKYAKTIFYLDGNKQIAEIKTGRKHQIRLSLKYLGKPIYGDIKYGGKRANRLMLHSYYLKIDSLTGNLSYLNGFEFYSKPKL
ncbi:23S rRNA pseudouridine955/2504/2580 synthase [Mycoplasmopsis mustelae]|uniref:RNA pseudouridylate synthase n=1 Tax=Mycoplasmopsis mustelae TaxID=171289 RepID=A0A4R7UCT0_9BACT|nr:RluA family pseudouridine synthase [Mycoplasmopsis mustelae]TDV24199.1 23S rRNA pseudouridine955/2504/2580 synthase [Mycoplasmopsis mustelae]